MNVEWVSKDISKLRALSGFSFGAEIQNLLSWKLINQ